MFLKIRSKNKKVGSDTINGILQKSKTIGMTLKVICFHPGLVGDFVHQVFTKCPSVVNERNKSKRYMMILIYVMGVK